MRLREVLHYDAETGVFVWVANRHKTKIGTVAGTGHNYYKDGVSYKSGYIVIGVDGKLYLAHRLAWLYVYGVFPEFELDHINLVCSDNRWCNLRAATRIENMRNIGCSTRNKSGAKGVCRNKTGKRWRAHLKINGSNRHLGTFDTVAEAAKAVEVARKLEHGNFARHT